LLKAELEQREARCEMSMKPAFSRDLHRAERSHRRFIIKHGFVEGIELICKIVALNAKFERQIGR
jgi:hypothetical protein